MSTFITDLGHVSFTFLPSWSYSTSLPLSLWAPVFFCHYYCYPMTWLTLMTIENIALNMATFPTYLGSGPVTKCVASGQCRYPVLSFTLLILFYLHEIIGYSLILWSMYNFHKDQIRMVNIQLTLP